MEHFLFCLVCYVIVHSFQIILFFPNLPLSPNLLNKLISSFHPKSTEISDKMLSKILKNYNISYHSRYINILIKWKHLFMLFWINIMFIQNYVVFVIIQSNYTFFATIRGFWKFTRMNMYKIFQIVLASNFLQLRQYFSFPISINPFFLYILIPYIFIIILWLKH